MQMLPPLEQPLVLDTSTAEPRFRFRIMLALKTVESHSPVGPREAGEAWALLTAPSATHSADAHAPRAGSGRLIFCIKSLCRACRSHALHFCEGLQLPEEQALSPCCPPLRLLSPPARLAAFCLFLCRKHRLWGQTAQAV